MIIPSVIATLSGAFAGATTKIIWLVFHKKLGG